MRSKMHLPHVVNTLEVNNICKYYVMAIEYLWANMLLKIY